MTYNASGLNARFLKLQKAKSGASFQFTMDKALEAYRKEIKA